MTELAVRDQLSPCSAEARARIEAFGKRLQEFPQVDLPTEHHIHAGVYSRTIYVKAGVAVAGVLVKIPTQLVASGHFVLSDGARSEEVKGFKVYEGFPGRQAAVVAIEDSAFTMLFATGAKTVEEAEEEFTDQYERLLTRKEQKCLEAG